MQVHITTAHKRAFAESGIINLPGLVNATLLNELVECFKWSIAHPGPIALGKNEGENISVVDNVSPDATPMFDELVNRSEFGDVGILRPHCLHRGGGMYKLSPIPATAGGHLVDGEPHRNAASIQANYLTDTKGNAHGH